MTTTQDTSATEASQETIVRGPSKFELMLALFDHTMDNGRTVTFVVGHGAAMMCDTDGRELGLTGAKPVKVAINEVGRESGDGESFLFKGYIPGETVHYVGGTTADMPPTEVDGYYNTRRNQGWLRRK